MHDEQSDAAVSADVLLTLRQGEDEVEKEVHRPSRLYDVATLEGSPGQSRFVRASLRISSALRGIIAPSSREEERSVSVREDQRRDFVTVGTPVRGGPSSGCSDGALFARAVGPFRSGQEALGNVQQDMITVSAEERSLHLLRKDELRSVFLQR